MPCIPARTLRKFRLQALLLWPHVVLACSGSTPVLHQWPLNDSAGFLSLGAAMPLHPK